MRLLYANNSEKASLLSLKIHKNDLAIMDREVICFTQSFAFIQS
ncbi:hypothetical protein HMPREF1985_00202 [Mitsuokella sp. oral taxon 131 str. W9106]|nr:hypothetical protein HMPREF1985_00202 [Mitsuokella sp. oral taxon 131 str. W9106]